MFNLMLDYALEYEIVEKNYARTFEISDDIVKEKEEAKVPHIIFTEDEMKVLWENVGKVQFVDWILMQCYMAGVLRNLLRFAWMKSIWSSGTCKPA